MQCIVKLDCAEGERVKAQDTARVVLCSLAVEYILKGSYKFRSENKKAYAMDFPVLYATWEVLVVGVWTEPQDTNFMGQVLKSATLITIENV